ncbi:DUF6494 family protein [Rubrimonas cliftonensis]|uniref:Uncharacterized protein n=1 Tax=Rubrimonas cliftonensis TaxID=89524 RepID=A0A1H3XFZ0_9RHOB|nr:DUF6494 family protein [Rubrimonas cliftonensis]SDZ97861.1 hypothetical protein SAMN05444370_102393 [Rubrimonas cliftonensis]
MDDEKFNMSMRKFLKQVGVTSQQEIEKAARAADASGALSGPLKARVTLTVEALGVSHVVEGDIETGA